MLLTSAILCDLSYLHTSFVRLIHLAMQACFYHLPPYIFFKSRCYVPYLKGGYAIEKIWTTIDGDASAASHDIGARNARLIMKLFEVDQLLEMLRVSLVTILAREMRLNFFFEIDQALEKMRVPLAMILAGEMRLKFYWRRPRFGDVASAACHAILARDREMRLKICWSRPSFGVVASTAGHFVGARYAIETFFWSLPTFGDVAGVASHGIGARNAIEFFWNRPSFGERAGAASHDVSARNAIEIFLTSTKLWRCCECR